MPDLTEHHIEEVRKLLPRLNVRGYSCNLQPRIRAGRVLPEEQVIRIYVTEKMAAEALAAGEALPGEIEGIPVDVVATGGEFFPLPTYAGRERPVRAGWSVGNENSQATGTIGCIVSDGTWEGILSNNHVLARSSNIQGHKAKIYEGILQPGAVDGGKFPEDFIAFLTKWTDFDIFGINRVDRAMALFARATSFRLAIQDIGLVRSTRDAEVGLEAGGTGRSTGFLEGKVFDTEAVLQVNFGQIIGASLTFEHQILISPPIGIPGDSGKLILDRGRKVMGLLFAGSEQYTACNHIADVLEGFGVEIVGAA